MPIYGYECNACGREFQTLVRSSEAPSCPSCESTDLTRRLSLIAAPARMKRGGGKRERRDFGDARLGREAVERTEPTAAMAVRKPSPIVV
jgi:putative FmdB family regulatory protein